MNEIVYCNFIHTTARMHLVTSDGWKNENKNDKKLNKHKYIYFCLQFAVDLMQIKEP